LISINNATGKFFHYWFVESENSSASVPLLLWLNGGPGCSSLDGLLYEHGPFQVNESDHTQLVYNPYTWTKLAHIIYLESPAGVGFSFSKTPADLATNDSQTADDNFNFLVSFLAAYPEHAGRDFYITGESYAGVYIPTLAQRISEGNAAGQSNINLKGIAVGNGCTGVGSGVCGTTAGSIGIRKNFLSSHGLVSPVLSQKIDAACGNYTPPSAACLALVAEASAAVGDVNIYDIYAPCISGGEAAAASPRLRVPRGEVLAGPDACIDGIAAAAYLNSDDVIQAIHVLPAMPAVESWTICSSSLRYTETAADLPVTVYPALAAQYRVLIFNGDVDACVPYTDNFAWTSGMGYPILSDWHPWLLDQQVAGYATVYTVPDAPHTFTFATVKGAGHMVAQYVPAAAFEMLSRFLANQPF